MNYCKALLLLVVIMCAYIAVGAIEYSAVNVIDVVQNHKEAIEKINNL